VTLKVKVQAKVSTKKGKDYKTLYVAIPSSVAELLRINEGDILWVTITTVDVGGQKKQAVAYFKP